MNKLTYYLLFVFSLLLFISCNVEDNFYAQPTVERSIYIDIPNSYLDQSDFNFLAQNKITNLYFNIFDVKYDPVHFEIPDSILQHECNVPVNFNVIPVVRIDNEIFEKIDTLFLQDFANKVAYKINEVYSTSFKGHTFIKYQIYCDWNLLTKNNYFKFLKFLRQEIGSDKKLSVVITLNHLKNQNIVGVPPAKEVVLKYYNFTNIKDFKDYNYIIDNNIANGYLDSVNNYPIKLNLSLPVYSCAIYYFKSDYWSYFKVFNSITEKNIASNPLFEINSDSSYNVIDWTTVEGEQIFPHNDLLIQAPSINELLKAKQVTAKFTKNNYEIIIYKYDTNSSKLLNNNDIEKIYFD